MYGFKYSLLVHLLSMGLHNKEMIFSKIILPGNFQNLVYILTQPRIKKKNNFRLEISELFPTFYYISYSIKSQSAMLVLKLLIVLFCEKKCVLCGHYI